MSVQPSSPPEHLSAGSIPSYRSPHLSPTGLETVQKRLRKFTGGDPVYVELDRWTTIGAVPWTDKTGKQHPDWRFISRPGKKESVSAIPFWVAKDGSIIIGMKDELRQTLRRGVLGFCAGAVDEGENPLDEQNQTPIDERNVVLRELKEELGVAAQPQNMLTTPPRAALLDSVTDCLNMSIPFCMGLEEEMKDIGKQELEPGEDIRPCFFHLQSLPALLTHLKTTGHPPTQEVASFIQGYLFARMEMCLRDQAREGRPIGLGEVKDIWDNLLGIDSTDYFTRH